MDLDTGGLIHSTRWSSYWRKQISARQPKSKPPVMASLEMKNATEAWKAFCLYPLKVNNEQIRRETTLKTKNRANLNQGTIKMLSCRTKSIDTRIRRVGTLRAKVHRQLIKRKRKTSGDHPSLCWERSPIWHRHKGSLEIYRGKFSKAVCGDQVMWCAQTTTDYLNKPWADGYPSHLRDNGKQDGKGSGRTGMFVPEASNLSIQTARKNVTAIVQLAYTPTKTNRRPTSQHRERSALQCSDVKQRQNSSSCPNANQRHDWSYTEKACIPKAQINFKAQNISRIPIWKHVYK